MKFTPIDQNNNPESLKKVLYIGKFSGFVVLNDEYQKKQ